VRVDVDLQHLSNIQSSAFGRSHWPRIASWQYLPAKAGTPNFVGQV
jgi:hypothetical protein